MKEFIQKSREGGVSTRWLPLYLAFFQSRFLRNFMNRSNNRMGVFTGCSDKMDNSF